MIRDSGIRVFAENRSHTGANSLKAKHNPLGKFEAIWHNYSGLAIFVGY